MGNSRNEVEETLNKELKSAKEQIFSIKELAQKANDKLKKSVQENKQKVAERDVAVKKRVAKNKQERKEKKEALRQSAEAFFVENNATAAQKKADDEKAYASACINYAFEVIEEAQLAIQSAALAQEHANEMKRR